MCARLEVPSLFPVVQGLGNVLYRYFKLGTDIFEVRENPYRTT